MNLDLDTKIIDITYSRVTTLHPKDSIKKAELIFSQIDRKVLPVVVNGVLRGVLLKGDFKNLTKTTHNLLKYYDTKYDFGEMTVEDYMVKNVKVLDIKSKVIDAINFFRTHRQYYIPIVDDQQLIGIVTPYDVFDFIITRTNLET